MSGTSTWGKILVGGAIAAGAVAAFIAAEPYLAETVVPAIKELGSTIGDYIAQAWSWIGEHVIGSADNTAIKAAETAQAALQNHEALAATAQELATKMPGNPIVAQLVGTLNETGSQIAEVAKNAATYSADKISGAVGVIMDNKAMAIGSAAAAGALIASASHKGGQVELPQEMTQQEPDSFTMREDMRRMQALMQARAAAMGGLQPAMAPARG